MLFTFNDEFIAAVAGGHTDADTLHIFTDALEAGAAEVVDFVRAKAQTHPDVAWDDDGLVFTLSPSQADTEFGTGTQPASPRFRQGVVSAVHPAVKAMEKVLNDER